MKTLKKLGLLLLATTLSLNPIEAYKSTKTFKLRSNKTVQSSGFSPSKFSSRTSAVFSADPPSESSTAAYSTGYSYSKASPVAAPAMSLSVTGDQQQYQQQQDYPPDSYTKASNPKDYAQDHDQGYQKDDQNDYQKYYKKEQQTAYPTAYSNRDLSKDYSNDNLNVYNNEHEDLGIAAGTYDQDGGEDISGPENPQSYGHRRGESSPIAMRSGRPYHPLAPISRTPRYSNKYFDKYINLDPPPLDEPISSVHYYPSESVVEAYKRDVLMGQLMAQQAVAAKNGAVAVLGSGSPTMATGASSLLDMNPNDDTMALASGYGKGWGKGGSHDHINHYVSKVNNDALGLLGLLGLLSLLSNILLLLLSISTTVAGRRKRDLDLKYDIGESEEAKRERIFTQLLPFLAPVAHVKNGQVPWECSLQGVCLTNRLLVKEYGYVGRPAGSRMTSAIVDLIGGVGKGKGKTRAKTVIEAAGLKGRNQKDCQDLYPTCKALRAHSTRGGVPFVIRVNDLPQLLKKMQQVTATTSASSD